MENVGKRYKPLDLPKGTLLSHHTNQYSNIITLLTTQLSFEVCKKKVKNMNDSRHIKYVQFGGTPSGILESRQPIIANMNRKCCRHGRF